MGNGNMNAGRSAQEWQWNAARLLALVLLIWMTAHARAADRVPLLPSTAGAPQAALSGESLTLLPDGRWLRAGGSGVQGPQNTITLEQGSLEERFPVGLQYARSGHTATVLPDGRILVLGGIGLDGKIVSQPEVIDPLLGTVEVLSAGILTPRTQHTATLLTSGEVLIVGGRDADGHPLSSVELLDPKSRAVRVPVAGLQIARFAHEASLLVNGEGLVWGGQNAQGHMLDNGEIYRPQTQLFEGPVGQSDSRISDLITAATQAPTIAETVPGADSSDVPLDAVLGIRFSKALPVSQLNAQTVSLVGPAGALAGTVVGAERGMLAFFTPAQQLSPGTTYTLFVSGLADESGRGVPLTTVRFTTRLITGAGPAAPVASANASADSEPAASTSGSAVGDVISQPGAPSSGEQAQSRITGTTESGNSSPSPQSSAKPSATSPSTRQTAASVAEDWTPRLENRHGAWRVLGLAGDPILTTSAVNTSSAGPNQTGVSGFVRKLNGRPLAGVSVSVGSVVTQTDSQGRFLLSDVAAGAQELRVDGRVVSNGGRHYTEHYLSVKVTQGSITSIAQPIYLPRVDPATEVSISSPADHDIVLTHPAMPGLEVIIPKGAVLRERDGNVVSKVSITPVPVDRAPYPAPTPFSVYFTLQPGGAYVDGDPGKAIKIVYPNYLKLPASKSVSFWNYDPSAGGWQIYGHGRVTQNAKQIVADESVGFRQIMTFGFATSPGDPLPPKGPISCGCKVGEPIDVATGLFTEISTDLVVDDVVPISVTRVYRTNDNQVRAVGVGTNLTYDMWLYGSSSQSAEVDLIMANGSRIAFLSGVGNQTPPLYAEPTPTDFAGAVLTIDEVAQQWVITKSDGTVLRFPGFATVNQLASITDRNGNTVTLTSAPNYPQGALEGNPAPITQITSPSGRYIRLFYDSENRLSMAQDSGGRSTSYTYDSAGHLTSATDAAGNTEHYAYDPVTNNMSVVTDKRGNTATQNFYDGNDRVKQQILADGTSWQFSYTLDDGGNATQVNVTDPRGYVEQYALNPAGYVTQTILALGKPEQETTSTMLDSSNRPTMITDALGRQTVYGYDSSGHLTGVTLLYGTSGAVTYTLTYDPVFHQLTGITDPLGHTHSLIVDGHGNPEVLTDALGNQSQLTFNSKGLPTTLTDALGNRSRMSYSVQGDLTSVTDPLSRTTQYAVDGLGRLVATTDPLGNVTQINVDALDRVTSVVNALGGTTTFNYDQNSNLLSSIDPNNVPQTFTYDARNRRHTYLDPAGNTATYTYDGLNNLTSFVDRKGQTTGIAYDGLNRPTVITYQDGSSITITWDAGSRARQFVDSVNGTITRNYDLLDRLTQEITPQGQVSYTYDLANRRQTLSASGQAVVNYTFDNNNRLTQVAQGNTVLGFEYDAIGRRKQVTLPNGIVGTFGFDAASQLTSIAYANGSIAVGNLSYGYDLDGRRTNVGGTLSGFVPPNVAPSMAYDGSNRLSTWNGSPLSYDANGNLTSMGSATYTWNARNQLVATSAGSASFSYDAFGRRVGATVNGTSASYLYDGINAVELSGNLLFGGAGIDDIFAQVGSGGTTSYLRDALGSTVAESGSTGTVAANYFYSSYGDSVNTSSSATPFQFTGRENDGATGLYYYRARYYSPQLGRFISEDPLELGGGSNFYAYVGGNPISFSDPFGLAPLVPPPPGTPYPPANIPGGPWSWSPNPQNPRGGQFIGPPPPGGGQRTSCTYTPKNPGIPRPYWKVNVPGLPAQRYDLSGNPQTIDQAHGNEPTNPPFLNFSWSLAGFAAWALTYSEPAN